MIKFRLRRLVLSFLFANIACISASHCLADATVNFVANSTWVEPRFPNGTPGVATYSASFSPVDAAVVAADANLAGAYQFDFFVTTAAMGTSNGDILVADALITSTPGQNAPGGYFNYVNANMLGSDVTPPSSALFPSFPSIEYSAFVTTPGATAASGPAVFDNLAGELYVTHFDSTDDMAATNFRFASFTLLPDANGMASATLSGQLQVRNQPEPLRSNFQFDFAISPDEVNFEDGINSMNPTGDFFSMFGSNQDLLDANDPGKYPNGATLFVPTDQAIADAAAAGVSWDVADLIVPDVEAALVSSTLGYDEADLGSLVGTPVGSTTPLTASSGNVFALKRGSLLYGNGLIVETDYQVDNGWIHVIDTIPVPEPSSLGILLSALLGLACLRRR